MQHMYSRGCWVEGAQLVWREFGCISLVFLVGGCGMVCLGVENGGVLAARRVTPGLLKGEPCKWGAGGSKGLKKQHPHS